MSGIRVHQYTATWKASANNSSPADPHRLASCWRTRCAVTVPGSPASCTKSGPRPRESSDQ
ncbi:MULTISPECIES: hypothetical protein [unclassified Streptomyces]|uniref:hypothetical protein n=1 Tax=unclassified Streptomyces TaxID=2593676 RepID=UPI003829CD68